MNCSDLYEEILNCYEYETRNPSVYGNVVLCQMESSKGSKELQLNSKRDENYLQ
jgi:hypothetical protein